MASLQTNFFHTICPATYALSTNMCKLSFHVCYHCIILIKKNRVWWQILAILWNSKFYKNPVRRSSFIRCKKTDKIKANTCISANVMHFLNSGKQATVGTNVYVTSLLFTNSRKDSLDVLVIMQQSWLNANSSCWTHPESHTTYINRHQPVSSVSLVHESTIM